MKLFKIILFTLSIICNSFCHANILEQAQRDTFIIEMVDFLNKGERTAATFNAEVANALLELEVGEDEATVMRDIWQLTAHDPSAFAKMLQGAHVRIQDNGFMYFKWEELKTARARISSHPSIPTSIQYGIVGPISHEILFGIVEVDGDIFTFFQMENTPWDRSFTNMVWHTMDAIQYLITGKNIGPYGISENTDKNPLMF